MYPSSLKLTPMSEDHAIYFASAEPGHKSAVTTGEQPGGEQPLQEPGDPDIT